MSMVQRKSILRLPSNFRLRNHLAVDNESFSDGLSRRISPIPISPIAMSPLPRTEISFRVNESVRSSFIDSNNPVKTDENESEYS